MKWLRTSTRSKQTIGCHVTGLTVYYCLALQCDKPQQPSVYCEILQATAFSFEEEQFLQLQTGNA